MFWVRFQVEGQAGELETAESGAVGFGAVVTGAIAIAQAIQHPGATALALAGLARAGLARAGPHLAGWHVTGLTLG
jgi:hypothetical protein